VHKDEWLSTEEDRFSKNYKFTLKVRSNNKVVGRRPSNLSKTRKTMGFTVCSIKRNEL